jgi:hypothetical protein
VDRNYPLFGIPTILIEPGTRTRDDEEG